ncbi:MAG: orotidine-5'-phosphate decarboxylase [Gammaproteobacteria bacterium]|nr:orotidine-5'-phosphate decarboxylase [Gammaproteobacteria bacterium]MYD76070.1 orotidine-5'-phosphate decarboxylase [Gammaproteobacteria bacterium]MYJ51240.1 orotidine-5'-phosphate decarboxylase [Gammaproteobacteria bacterium]
MGDFYGKLNARWQSSGSLLCVGLDPVLESMPPQFVSARTPFADFCREIVDATAGFACAFKFQAACFGQHGAEDELERAIHHVLSCHPGVPVILDSKRGDIGSTAKRYACEAFTRYGADAVTVNPYLGTDSIEAFTDHADRGVILLCRTSNPGSADLQELDCGGMKVYERVAHLAAEKWNRGNNVALVVGATYPEVLGRVRGIVGDMPLLVPGVGAQGGDLGAVLENGLTEAGHGLMINVSRHIVQAGERERGDPAKAAHDAAELYYNEINRLRSKWS